VALGLLALIGRHDLQSLFVVARNTQNHKRKSNRSLRESE
jgi:hypothetical protein